MRADPDLDAVPDTEAPHPADMPREAVVQLNCVGIQLQVDDEHPVARLNAHRGDIL